MKITLSWIQSYVPDLQVTAREFADKMTMSGTKVTGYEETGRNLKDIVVGRIESLEKHPAAENLTICQVNVGSEIIPCITAAGNLAVGNLVPVALEGGCVERLHGSGSSENGVVIHRENIRGYESRGVLCSVEELGFVREETTDETGYDVFVFHEDDDMEVGSDVVDSLGLSDVIFTFEPPSARKDCYRVLGIAREVAAVFGKEFVEPSIHVKANEESVEDYVTVKVRDGVNCSRYCARVVKNFHLGPSPRWMQRRLISSGIRPVNNLVDITNYVMEEYGQPVIGFNLDSIHDHTLILERSEDGNKFRTLDGTWRNVGADVLMISDGLEPIGIAGIMGDDTTKVTSKEANIVLEAACFDGAYIRKTSKRLGLTTEISRRYALGLNANYAEAGLNRACQLIEELGCGEVVGGMIDECSTVVGTRHIEFHPEWINRQLGTDMTKEEMLHYLYALGFEYDETSGDLITPAGRQDIQEEAEVAGEVARLYGYDRIPMTIPRVETTRGSLPRKMLMENRIRSLVEYYGYSQALTYSFEGPEVYDRLRIPDRSSLRNSIRIHNPLSDEYSIMRTQSVSSMLRVLANNAKNRHQHVRFYELANIYIPRDLTRNELPEERMQLTLGTYGGDDFFALKGIIAAILQDLGLPIRNHMKHVGLMDLLSFRNEQERSFLHPGRQAEIYYSQHKIGYIGEIHPGVSKDFGIAERVNVVVLDIPSLMAERQPKHHFHGLNRYAKITRDLSVLAPDHVPVADIASQIMLIAREQLENMEMAGPVYRSDRLPEGTKSVTWHLRFQAEDHDITGPEVQKILERIREYLQETGVSVRQ